MKSYQIFDELSEHITLRISSCQTQYHDLQWQETKRHPDYDFWLIVSGKIGIDMGGKTGTAKAGDLIFFYPNVPYTAYTGQEGCRFVYVHFDFGIGGHSRILNEFRLSGIVPGESVLEEVDLFHKAFERYSQKSNMSSIRLKGCLTILLAKIIEIYGEADVSVPQPDEPEKRGAGKHLETLQPVFRHMHDRLHKPIMIQELADLVGMSEKYFITFFKQAVGITPGKYLYQIRMNRARDYLYRRTYSVKQIAELLGYPDPYTFSKAFKKYYNRSPSQFV